MQEPKQPIPSLEVSSPVLDPILPHATAFQLLIMPITAVGIGEPTASLLVCIFQLSTPPPSLRVPGIDLCVLERESHQTEQSSHD